MSALPNLSSLFSKWWKKPPLLLWSLTIEETRVYMYINNRCGLIVYVCLYYKYI
nr:MAG TPA: hypothetical protein [Caudoviricetes sp.]